jgi:outer membrane protein TolC
MKLSIPALCTFLSFSSLFAESPPGDSPPAPSIDAVLRRVLTHNPGILEARARWEAMKHRIPQAAAWDDPKVSAGSRVARFVDIPANGFTDQMLSIEQMIPLSGRNRSRERIAAAEALSSREEVRRRELDAAAKARAAYIRLGKNYALLELVRANESSLHQTLEISRAKLEVGGQSQADVLMAENEVAKSELARRDLLRSISEDASQLQALMDRDPFTPLAQPSQTGWSDGSRGESADQLRRRMLDRRPEIRMAQAALASAQARLQLAQREWTPDPALSFQAQHYNGGAQAVSEVSAGVSITLPWLNETKYREEEREAASGVEAARRALDGARSGGLALLRDQLQKIDALRHHLDLYTERLLPRARQTVDANRTSYESGKTAFLELVMSQRALFELESALQEYRANYAIARAELDALVGADLPAHPPAEGARYRHGK